VCPAAVTFFSGAGGGGGHGEHEVGGTKVTPAAAASLPRPAGVTEAAGVAGVSTGADRH